MGSVLIILNGVEVLKKYFYISILLGTFALSGCTDVEADNKEVTAEVESKVKFEDEFTDRWNKINITLN